MHTQLLHSIYNLGDQMYASLHENDLESFFAQMEERTEQLQRLASLKRPNGAQEEWDQMGQALKQQQQRLADEFAAQEKHLSEAIGDLVRFRTAHSRYNPPPARRAILNKNLRG